MIHTPPDRSRPAGFSLTELLVVIGIIVVLIGILIPVVSRVRQAAWSANTQNTLANISGAIERYHMDHRAYPGVIRNGRVNVPPTQQTGMRMPIANGFLTSTENLVVALMGGLQWDGNPSNPPVFVADDVGRGAIDFASNRRNAAYIDEQSANLFPKPWEPDQQPLGGNDSRIPEFMDRFPDSLPILYVRANVGATGILHTTQPPAQQGNYQYVHDNLLQYLRATDPLSDEANAIGYFTHPTLPNTARAKDAYMLISPGRDRVYGTEEDITYPPR